LSEEIVHPASGNAALIPDDPVEKADFLFNQARRYKKQFKDERDEATEFYRGRQWKRALKRPVKNVIFTTIEAEVPILNDSQPATDVIPVEPDDRDQADILDAAMKYTYEINNLEMRRSQAIRSALIRGDGWIYVDWDPDKSNGEGEIVLQNMPDEFVFWDPHKALDCSGSVPAIRPPLSTAQERRTAVFFRMISR